MENNFYKTIYHNFVHFLVQELIMHNTQHIKKLDTEDS
jgi:hypothetical protein